MMSNTLNVNSVQDAIHCKLHSEATKCKSFLEEIEAHEMISLYVDSLSLTPEKNKPVATGQSNEDAMLERHHKKIQFWVDLFISKFLVDEAQQYHDDLLCFVKHDYNKSQDQDSQNEPLEFYRRDSKRMPIGDSYIDWKKTVYLNYILQSFTYTLTIAVCKRNSNNMRIINHHNVEVFANPSSRHMDSLKPKNEKITYPDIYFSVDGYQEFIDRISIDLDQDLCIELTATEKTTSKSVSIFIGSASHALMIKSIKQPKVFTGCASRQLDQQEPIFVSFRGSNGTKAEMAVIESEWIKYSSLSESTTSTNLQSDNSSLWLDFDCDDFRVSLDKRPSYFNRMMSKISDNPIKQSNYPTTRSLSSGNIFIINEQELENSSSDFARTKRRQSKRSLSSTVGKLERKRSLIGTGLISSCQKDNAKLTHQPLHHPNIPCVFTMCLPTNPQRTKELIGEDMKTLNAYVTSISMSWSNVLDNIKVGRRPMLSKMQDAT